MCYHQKEDKMDYFYTPEMEGERPFKCYVCGKILVVNLDGEYIIKLSCNRCKTKIVLETRKPVPVILAVKHGELTHL